MLSLLLAVECAWLPVARVPHRHLEHHAVRPAACESQHVSVTSSSASAKQLLVVLDQWLRRQSVSSVMSRQQASSLLEELRSDRRFWAQQRRQFARVWLSLEEGLKQEKRPLAEVLGPGTSSRLLDALEQMDEQPDVVNAVIRSEACSDRFLFLCDMRALLRPLLCLFFVEAKMDVVVVASGAHGATARGVEPYAAYVHHFLMSANDCRRRCGHFASY